MKSHMNVDQGPIDRSKSFTRSMVKWYFSWYLGFRVYDHNFSNSSEWDKEMEHYL